MKGSENIKKVSIAHLMNCLIYLIKNVPLGMIGK